MGLPGHIDSSVYSGLRDVLQRYPTITTVAFEPDSIAKEFLRATVRPARITPSSGSEPPVIDVEWRFDGETEYYRIHYADPNTGFNCGWHRDDDHSDLGATHFQYERPTDDAPTHEAAAFDATTPPKILWECLDDLFSTRLPQLTGE